MARRERDDDLRRRAADLLRLGPVGDAVAAHVELTRRAPRDADAWYNLGYLLRSQRHFDAALEAYDRALAAGVARPEEVRLNRAAILSDHLGRDADAATELEVALAGAPGFVPALLNLGTIHEDRGELDLAINAYDRALRLDPACSRALARRGMIDVAEGRGPAAVDRLRGALDCARGLDARAEIGFALATALEAMGDHGTAFACVDAANADARAATPPARRYDPQAQAALVDALMALPPEPTPAASAADAPILVLGMFRSGSTLLEQLLGRHPHVTAAGELEILPAVARALAPYPRSLTTLSPARVNELRSSYLAEVRRLHPRPDRVTDKRPDNFLHLALAHRLFPGVPALHTVRDPMDVIASVYFLHFDDGVPWGQDLGEAAHWYVQYHRLMAHWRDRFGSAIRDVRYERLVAEPEAELRGAVEWLGLDWDPRMLSPTSGAGAVRTPSAWAVRQPLNTRSVGRWRRYARELEPARGVLAAAGIVRD